jgi:hypothetical protein
VTQLVITIASEVITLLGVIATCYFSHSKTIYRIEQLEKKQDKHNNLIERTYDCENKISLLEQEVHLYHK